MKFTLPDKFYVRTPSPELFKIVQLRLFELGFKWRGMESIIDRFTYGEQQCIGVLRDRKMTYSPEDIYSEYPNVSITDLFLTEKPDPCKVINILPWSVIIRGDNKVDIGCQENIDIGRFKTMMAEMGGTEEIKLGTYQVKLGRSGFRAAGCYLTWETWDEFVKAFNAATKE